MEHRVKNTEFDIQIYYDYKCPCCPSITTIERALYSTLCGVRTYIENKSEKIGQNNISKILIERVKI